ncbi:MAG: xylanase [Actinobacteria bacterium]|nr:xylanase [Actinomycetota bacterium]
MSRPVPTRRDRRTRRRIRRKRVLVALGVVVAVVVSVAAASVLASTPAREEAVARPATSSPDPFVPASAADRLLATTTDPGACAVEFAGDGVALDPQLQVRGVLYRGLPIPRAAGRVFAGWYPTAVDAAAGTTSARINGADLVDCTDRRATLHAAWTTPEANRAAATRLPILMYHQFTTRPEGEDGWLRLNYAFLGDFDAQMAHIEQTGFYVPTWDEVDAFIDGALFLPARSVVITDDDADPTWLELAAPVVDRRHLLTTSFVITSARTEPSPNSFVLQRSHTHDMHRAGPNGKGRLVNDDVATIVADLEESARILGAKDVVAYPFGHYDDRTKEAVRAAGFALGRTIEPGYVRIGTDKLALPVVRVNYGMTVDELAAAIG